MDVPHVLPLEITAPLIQRLARKGVAHVLEAEECAQLCECLLFHIETRLKQTRLPRLPADGGDLDDAFVDPIA